MAPRRPIEANTDAAEGWAPVRLPEVCAINPPKPRAGELPDGTPVTFVPMPAVDADRGAITTPQSRSFAAVRKGFTSFRDGDVILAKITPCMENGKAAVVSGMLNGYGFGSTEFHVLRSSDAVLPEYVYHFVRQECFRRDAAENMTGSVGQKRVPAAYLDGVELPLPPVAEQKRIVAKVEELLARVNAARQRLARVSAILKRFRQSVLAAACSGLLTTEWREANTGGAKIDEAIESIRRRREARTNAAVQKERLRQIYETEEENDHSELPEEWRFVCLAKLCESLDYGTSSKSQPSGRVPVLRMGNIQNAEIEWTDLVFTSDNDEIERYSLRPNTVLFNRTNSPELVGKTAIYRGERPAIFAGYLIRINHLPELNPEYLNLCLNTQKAKEFCSRVKTDGVSQSNINATKLGTFNVPFCPVAEQREIVRRVDALFALADKIEAHVKAATARVEKTTQAILAKAFRGELVPTEAELARQEGRDYEPASALLERIRAGRGTANKHAHDGPRLRKA